MMKITGLSHLFKWKNLHNWWLTKYFFDRQTDTNMHYMSNTYLYYNIYLYYIYFHVIYLIFQPSCICLKIEHRWKIKSLKLFRYEICTCHDHDTLCNSPNPIQFEHEILVLTFEP